jgi:hypothetical protein
MWRTVSLLALILITATASMYASAEERAQILKAKVIRQFVLSGWQLTQESSSQVVFEAKATGAAQILMPLFLTGASGSAPIVRCTVTIVPESEHYTHYQATLVMESKNAFGQPTTIAITNKKALADMTAKLKAASGELPQKYRFVPTESTSTRLQR